MKFFLKTFSILLIILFGLDFGVSNLNLMQYKNDIIKHVNSKVALNLQNVQNIKIKLLPLPKIILNKVYTNYQNHQLRADKVQFYILNPYSKIEIKNAHARISYNKHLPYSEIKNLILNDLKKINGAYLKIDNINLEILDSTTNIPIHTFKNLSSIINCQDQIMLKILDQKNSLTIKTNSLKDIANLQTEAIYNNIKLSTNLLKDKKSSTYKIAGYTKIQFLDDNKKNHDQYIKGYTEITDTHFQISNLTQNNEKIDGKIQYYIPNGLLKIFLHVKEFEFSKLPFHHMPMLLDYDFQKFIQPFIDIKFDKLKYLDTELSNIAIKISSWKLKSETLVMVENILINMPGDSSLKIYGKISDKEDLIFQGEAIFSSKECEKALPLLKEKFLQKSKYTGPLLMNTKFAITKNMIRLLKTELALKNLRANFTSTIFDYSKDNKYSYNSMVCDSLNLDNLGIKEKIIDFMHILYNSDFDASEESLITNTDNFKILRNENGSKDFSFKSKSLIFAGIEFKDTSVDFNLKKDEIAIDNLSLTSPQISINSNFKLNTSYIKPELYAQIKFRNISNSVINNIIDIDNEFASQNKNKSTNTINLYSINKFNGKFDILFENFDNPYKINKLRFIGNLLDSNLSLSNISADAMNGTLSGNGAIYLRRPTYYTELALGLNNIDPEILLSKLFPKNNSGYMSLAGKLTCKAENINQCIKNLNGNFNFIGKDITHKGFGLNELVELAQNKDIPLNNSKERLDYYSKYGSTTFSDIFGELQIQNGIANINNMNIKNKAANGSMSLSYRLKDKKFYSVSKFVFLPHKDSKPIEISFTDNDNSSKMNMEELEKYIVRYNNK